MKVVWALLCQKVGLSERTNELSIYGELDTIIARSIPFHAPDFVLIARVVPLGSEPRSGAMLNLESPDGDIISRTPINIHPKAERFICDIQDQVFSKPGKYLFHIVVNAEIVHKVALHIKLEKGIH